MYGKFGGGGGGGGGPGHKQARLGATLMMVECAVPARFSSQAHREVGHNCPGGGGCQREWDALEKGWEREREGVKEQHVLLLPKDWQVLHLKQHVTEAA